MGVCILASLLVFFFGVVARSDCATFENVYIRIGPHIYDERYVFIKKGDFLKDFVFDATRLIITNQSIPVLKTHSLGNLPWISVIEIKQCGVEEIEAGALENLPPMTELKITHNELKEIGYGVFNGLNMGTLTLINNKISRIANEAFGNMHLDRIFLSYNRISEYESEWFAGTPVGSVYVNHNYLDYLPADASKYLRDLKGVHFIWDFHGQGNRIRRVGKDTLRGVSSLGFFDLKENGLEELEPGLFDSVNSVVLVKLTHNNLSQISEDLFKNTHVYTLQLEWNNLRCVPLDSIKNNVGQLYLEGNPLSCPCLKMLEEWQEANPNGLRIEDLETFKDSYCF